MVESGRIQLQMMLVQQSGQGALPLSILPPQTFMPFIRLVERLTIDERLAPVIVYWSRQAVSRLLPGVMGNEASATDESFTSGLLEYPHYTRPADFRGWEVPEVLRNGDHARIESWRRAMALQRTIEERPDLIMARGGLSEEERRLLEREDLRSEPRDRPRGAGGTDGPGPDAPSAP